MNKTPFPPGTSIVIFTHEKRNDLPWTAFVHDLQRVGCKLIYALPSQFTNATQEMKDPHIILLGPFRLEAVHKDFRALRNIRNFLVSYPIPVITGSFGYEQKTKGHPTDYFCVSGQGADDFSPLFEYLIEEFTLLIGKLAAEKV